MSNTVYINVSGTWKQADAYYVNVGGTWKTGTEFQVNISNSWKGEALAGGSLPTIANIITLDYLNWSMPTIGIIDAKSGINSPSLDYTDWSMPVAGRQA